MDAAIHLIGDLSIYDNVELPLVYRGMTRGERRSNSDASPSLARSPAIRPFCLPTNRRAISIRVMAKR